MSAISLLENTWKVKLDDCLTLIREIQFVKRANKKYNIRGVLHDDWALLSVFTQ